MGKKRIFIVVKTYPSPSKGYVETVCTAGVTDTGDWIRLYPVSYRYLEKNQQYPKYAWIEVEVKKAERDHRKESYTPKMESIKVVRRPLGGKNQWEEAKSLLLPRANKSLCELTTLTVQGISLGIFKPENIKDFYWKEESHYWDNNELIEQQALFGIEYKPLEKIPYSFHYRFKCYDEKCNGHDIIIVDWEIYQAYRTWRRKYQDQEVLQKIKDKWQNTLFSPDRDSYFIVGTHHVFKTFMILGVFWPPKDERITLF